MIFLSAFTHSIVVKEYEGKRRAGQFYEEYKWLLRSINKVYPDAVAVLFNFEGIININELKSIHQKTIVFNWNKHFKEYLGIDLNYLSALKTILDLMDDNIIMLDPDCLVIKNFDELLTDDVDITAVTRGRVNWRSGRHDIIFAPAIYHKENRNTVKAYVDHLYLKAYKLAEQTKDFWSNVQASVTDLFLSAGMNLQVDFNGFPPEYGRLKIDDYNVKLKVIPQYILSYPIQIDDKSGEEKYYPETKIIHYKNYKDRSTPEKVFNKWMNRDA
jgi:hypothetical protein